MSSKFTVLFAAIALAGLTPVTKAHENHGEHGHGDIMPYVSNGKIITGSYDFTDGIADPDPLYVYEGELSADYESTSQPGGDAPGFATDGSNDALIEYALPANTALTFTVPVMPVLGVNAAYWDGQGAVNFVPTPHDILLEKELVGATTLDGTATTKPGFAIFTTNGDGVEHGHYDRFIVEDDDLASEGIYLYSIILEAGGLVSDPIYFVLAWGGSITPEMHEEAAHYVETTIVPEPATAMLMVAAGAGLFLRRRRAV